ncbi:unnamed protein product [Cladocopium goreaui]|uniref:Uncharacterized protein n=1 Tax=Cladocopium goreaui TaxID=2562237 RepID=A0A9P1GFJ6_9DINO|nr:unnamed protein product [Cladocopium goreaui]CAI4012131.1 unnamed protein product [Cladocopium goreaui]
MHRWLGQLHGIQLQTYPVSMKLEVFNNVDVEEISVPTLLPHEVLHALAMAGPEQFSKSMLGGRGEEALQQFWDHCLQLPHWKNHPAFAGGEAPKGAYLCMRFDAKARVETNEFEKHYGISVRKLFFTERNTRLNESSSYPELGTAFKAAHIKMILWFMTRKAIEFANATGVPHLNLGPHVGLLFGTSLQRIDKTCF